MSVIIGGTWTQPSRQPQNFAVNPINAFTVTGSGAGNGVYTSLQTAFNNLLDGGTVTVRGMSLFNNQAGFCDRNNCTMKTDGTGPARFTNKTTGDSLSQNSKKGIVVLGHYDPNLNPPTGTFVGGNGWTFQDIEFENAGWDNVSDVNFGAVSGIKLLGGTLTLTRCKFIGCTHGVHQGGGTFPQTGGVNSGGGYRTDTNTPGTITLNNCLFDGCGMFADPSGGNFHGTYLGEGNGTVLNATGCTFQYTYWGHCCKTRTNTSTFTNCIFNKASNTYAYLTTSIGNGIPVGASRAIDCSNGGVISVQNCTFYSDISSQGPPMIQLGGDLGIAGAAQTTYATNSFTGSGNLVYSTEASLVYLNYKGQALIQSQQGASGAWNAATGGNAVPAGCDKWPNTAGWVNEPNLTTAPAPRMPASLPPVQVPNWNGVTGTNVWYEIQNSNMDQLDATVLANDPSFNNAIWEAGRGFDSTLSYTGASFDYTLGQMYFCAGGGDGTMYNGWFQFDCASLAWSIIKYPSQLRTTDWNNSQTLFTNTGRFPGATSRGTNSPFITTKGYFPPPSPQVVDGTNDYTTYTPDCWSWPTVTGVLGASNNDPTKTQPCAAQYYGGQVVVPGIGAGGAAAVVDIGVTGPVLYDIHAAPPTWRQIDSTFEGIGYVSSAINNHRNVRKADCYTFWDATNAKIFYMGDLYGDFYNVVAYDPVTNTRYQGSSGNVTPPGPSAQYYYLLWNRSIGSPMFDQRKFYFHQRLYGWHWTMDFSTANLNNNYLPVASTLYPIDQTFRFNQSSLGILDRVHLACYVPVLGASGSIVAVCYSGRTVAIDTVTGNVTEIIAAGGNSIVADVQDGYIANGEWGRMRYYAAKKAIVLVSAAYRNIKVLKVA